MRERKACAESCEEEQANAGEALRGGEGYNRVLCSFLCLCGSKSHGSLGCVGGFGYTLRGPGEGVMQQLSTIAEMRAWSHARQKEDQVISLVPTMGALHTGHLSLITKAQQESDVVVVSIYVNPTQFDSQEDLENYPNVVAEDIALCEQHGVAAVFTPSTEEIYPNGFATFVDVVGNLTDKLCGMARPGHFRGVATICTKLFTIVQPQVTVFGQKDLQQALMIGRMIGDLNLPIELHVAPTVREADGLAMSSRNRRLDLEQRQTASAIPAALDAANARFLVQERDANALINAFAEEMLQYSDVEVDYADIVDLDGFKEMSGEVNEHCVLAVAIIIGGVRLIDHIHLGQPTTLVPAAHAEQAE